MNTALSDLRNLCNLWILLSSQDISEQFAQLLRVAVPGVLPRRLGGDISDPLAQGIVSVKQRNQIGQFGAVMGIVEDESVDPIGNDLADSHLATHNGGNAARHGFQGWKGK